MAFTIIFSHFAIHDTLPAQARAPSVEAMKNTAFRIGIVTGDVNQGADDILGAKELIRLYGAAENGGIIRHLIYPDNFMDEQETTKKLVVSLADDPLIKVIVVNQAVPGTAESFKIIKSKRPDILCFAGEAHEDMDMIAQVSDLVVNADFISRGFLIPHTARELGVKTFIHISFPRHMSHEELRRRSVIMEQACKDLGITFVYMYAPDPASEIGIEGAQEFIMEKVPGWIRQYGKNTAFFCTNDVHTEPLIRQIAAHGGYFIESDIPSPLLGYPEAFGVGIPEREINNSSAVLRLLEKAVIKAGAGGRLGTWVYSLGFCQTAGLGEFGRIIASGQADISDTRTLLECFGKFSPKAKWNLSFYTDAQTGKPIRNVFLIYQDTYIFGKGFMKSTEVKIPEKYLLIK
jgi:hypothetical protein